MPVIDFALDRDEKQCTLVSFTPRKSPAVEGCRLIDVALAFELNADDARLLEKQIPGCLAVYEKAKEYDDWKHRSTTTPGFSTKAEISDVSRAASVMKGEAEVRALSLRASKRSVVLTAKLRFDGQPSSVGTPMLELIGSAAELHVEQIQQTIQFPGPAPEKGDLAVAGVVAGRVIGVEKGEVVLDDFGQSYRVKISEVASTIALVPEAGADDDVEALVVMYEKAMLRAKLSPSWQWLVEAMCDADGVGLTREAVDKAIETQRQDAKDNAATG